ncbi:MAG TPA: MarR family transcriptional regulator [Actinocrinis sp.]|nr:MarR family transcriptional regulator [Actinocrinis sp.]
MAQAERTVNPNMRLDAQLCFALHAASRAFDGLYRVTLSEAGLTYPQYLVMLVLWEHGDLTVKELGRKLRLDSGTLSPLLKRLESAGWLERQRTAADERSVMVCLTEAGTELQERACDVPLHSAASSGLNLAQATELRSLLAQLTESLDSATGELATQLAARVAADGHAE